MVTTGALLHGDAAAPSATSIRPSIRWRCSSAAASPPSWRVRRGSAQRWGYDEINLNCGCPSRARAARRLRRLPDGRARRWWPTACGDARRVADAGDGQAPHRHRPQRGLRLRARLRRHRGRRRAARSSSCMRATPGCKGLSPKENREVPPLRYEVVHRLKRDFPQAALRAQRRPDLARRAQAQQRMGSTA